MAAQHILSAMEKTYDILFAGQLLEGTDPDEARKSIANLFKANATTVEKLFSGQPQLIKRGVDKTTAAKYRNAMHQAGAVAVIKVSDSPGRQAPAAPAAAPAEAPAAGAAMTMAERVAALAGDNEPVTADPTPTATPKPAHTPGTAATPDTDNADEGLTLAPAGSDVLAETERKRQPPVNVDTSALELAEVGAQIGEPPNVTPAVVADISHLTLDETGADIPMLASELEPLDIDTSQIDLAPEGSDFSDCAPAPAPAVEPDLSAVSLAEAGAELLQPEYRKPPPPAAPDVAHIQLEDEPD